MPSATHTRAWTSSTPPPASTATTRSGSAAAIRANSAAIRS